MALADTSSAIGAVSALLKARIDAISAISTSIGRPSDTASTNPHLNLFLYEINFDPHLKNTPLNEGEKAPLWLVLKYLLTAFETATDSDSEKAHEHLGAAIRAVQTDDLLKLNPTVPTPILKALDPNPSTLHVTFDEAPSDLLAKLMQGPDDKLRLSVCFQVRPVMIASAAPGDFSLLVGVDYTNPPALAQPYVGIDVIPSMGARIEEISPTGFEVNDEVTIRGTDLHLANLSVMLGPVELPVTMQQPDQLMFKIDPAIIAASAISAGSHPVTVIQTLTGTGKKRVSNAVIGNLVPTLTGATVSGLTVHPVDPAKRFATIQLSGLLLGSDADDTILALYREGRVYKMYDVLVPPTGPPPPRQTVRRRIMVADDAVEVGEYLVILRVNSQQAPQSPQVKLSP